MPARKKAAAAAEPQDKVAASPPTRREAVASEADAAYKTYREELAAQQALTDARAAALINEPAKAKPDPNGDIDQRMAALEQDHIRMGARPAKNA